MKAMVYTNYGTPDDLEMREIDRPQVRENDVLVRVHAASLNWLDWHFLTGAPFMVRLMAGFLRPKINVLGIDVAGRVEAVGASVTRFREGDEVFGAASHGCYAEFVCVSEDLLVPKPANLTFEEASRLRTLKLLERLVLLPNGTPVPLNLPPVPPGESELGGDFSSGGSAGLVTDPPHYFFEGGTLEMGGEFLSGWT